MMPKMIVEEAYVSETALQPLYRVYSKVDGQEHGYCLREKKTGVVYTDEVIIPQSRSKDEFEETGTQYVPPVDPSQVPADSTSGS